MADKKFCHDCYQKHISKPSTVWCFECEQAFCLECETSHSSTQSSKGHVTTPVKTYLDLGESIRQIRTHCLSHDEKYQTFCSTHDVPLCSSCVENHSCCNEVKPLTKSIQNIKLSQTAIDIDEGLNDLDKNVSKIRAYLLKNQEILNEKKNDIVSEIRKTRQIINEHLDKLEKRLAEEVTDLKAKGKIQLNSLLQSLDDINDKAMSYRNQIDVLKKHDSDLQTFLVLRQISLNINSSEKDLKTMMENSSFDQLSLECDINDKLTRLGSRINKFGKVRLQKAPCNMTIDNRKQRQAQSIVFKYKSVDHLKISQERPFATVAKCIHGCDMTSNDIIILTDYDGKRLICTDSTGKQLFLISVAPTLAFDVTVIGDTTVAVTGAADKIISIVDINSRSVKRCISVGYDSYGVTHRKGTLFVCARYHGILAINLTNDKITTIIQCKSTFFSYITSYKEKLYYTDDKSETVTCCDMNGKTIWIFEDHGVMRAPFGITTDKTGRVYVCSNGNNSIIALSEDGIQSRTIISSDKGLKSPSSLHFDIKSNNLLVANKMKRAFLFHVST